MHFKLEISDPIRESAVVIIYFFNISASLRCYNTCIKTLFYDSYAKQQLLSTVILLLNHRKQSHSRQKLKEEHVSDTLMKTLS